MAADDALQMGWAVILQKIVKTEDLQNYLAAG